MSRKQWQLPTGLTASGLTEEEAEALNAPRWIDRFEISWEVFNAAGTTVNQAAEAFLKMSGQFPSERAVEIHLDRQRLIRQLADKSLLAEDEAEFVVNYLLNDGGYPIPETIAWIIEQTRMGWTVYDIWDHIEEEFPLDDITKRKMLSDGSPIIDAPPYEVISHGKKKKRPNPRR